MLKRSAARRPYDLGYAILILAVLLAIAHGKHLATDGVYFFVTMIDTGDFFIVAPARLLAELSIQWMVVAGVRAGISNLVVLQWLFGLSILLPFVVSFVLCRRAAGELDAGVLAFFLLSMAGINLTTDFCLYSEHQAMTMFAWPALFISVQRRPIGHADGAILVGLLLALGRSYQTAIGPALLVLLLLALRLYRGADSRERAWLAAGCLAALVAVGLSAWPVIHPRDPANRASFIRSLLAPLESREALTAVAFSVLFFASVQLRNPNWLRACWVLLAAAAVAIVSAPGPISAATSFESRTLTLWALPGLMVLAAIMANTRMRPRAPHRRVLIACVTLLALTNVRSTYEWSAFTDQYRSTLATKRGYVALADSGLASSPYVWAWTNPLLSVVWGAPCANTIILNSPHQSWEPYDPRSHFPLVNHVGRGSAVGGAGCD